jgi:hypothetical protein
LLLYVFFVFFFLILHFCPIILFIKCWCCFGRLLGNGKCAPQSRPQFHNVVDFATTSIDLEDLNCCGYVITLACVGCIVIKFWSKIFVSTFHQHVNSLKKNSRLTKNIKKKFIF